MRTPVTDPALGAPACYGMHRGDEDEVCARCPARRGCAPWTARSARQRTVAEAAEAAAQEYRASTAGADVAPEALAVLAGRLWQERGGFARGWGVERRWVAAMEAVSRVCRAASWDPRTYVRAQVETWGWYCRERGFAFAPSSMLGPKAADRFRRWADRNGRRHGDATHDDRVDRRHGELLAGETAFGCEYFRLSGVPLRFVEASVQKGHPAWSLAETAGVPHIRLPALFAACVSVHPVVPHRVLVPDTWTWRQARQAVAELFVMREPEVVTERPLADLDPSLGERV